MKSVRYKKWDGSQEPFEFKRKSIVDAFLDNIMKGMEQPYELRAVRKNGTKINVRVSPRMLTTGVNPIRITAVADITEYKKAEEKLKASLNEKETLLKEIHHRVKNNMQVISSLLSLQERKINNADLRDIYLKSENRIRSMALVHEKLYGSDNLSNIDFSDYIKTITAELYQLYNDDPKEIRIDIRARKVYLDINKAIPCGLIVNELISNSLSHAFPRELKIKGMITVTLDEKKGTVELAVKDNGIGIPGEINPDKSDTLGLELVSSLSRTQLMGELDIDRKNGTAITLKFRK